MSSIDPKTSPAEEIKSLSEYAEEPEQGQCMSVDSMGSFLSQSHREYLLSRHGTLDLDPIPSFSDADPYNWPTWKKLCNLILVAFHAGISTATGASIIPAYKDITTDLNISMQQASYLTSLQIAIIGGAPFLWRPLSNRLGRRPIFLLSVLLSLVCNVGCAKSYTYASMAACSALQAFFISPVYFSLFFCMGWGRDGGLLWRMSELHLHIFAYFRPTKRFPWPKAHLGIR